MNAVTVSDEVRPRGCIFFILNSAEHKISTAHKKLKCSKTLFFLGFKLSDVVFILLINVEMPTIVGILTLMSRINVLS